MGTGWAAGGAPGGRRRLGEVLVAGQVLTEAQLDEAPPVQREDKGRRRRLGEVITALGLADEAQIARASRPSVTSPSWSCRPPTTAPPGPAPPPPAPPPFIPKPFGEAELRSEVAALLQRQPALVEHPA